MKWRIKGKVWGSGEGNRNKEGQWGDKEKLFSEWHIVSAWRVTIDLDFTIKKGNQWLAPSLRLAASAVLISGPASVSNFQEEPLEITMFNSLSWPPGILPPPSATEKKQGVGRRRVEEGGREEGRENKMVLVRFNVRLPLFPCLYATSAEVIYRWWVWPHSYIV